MVQGVAVPWFSKLCTVDPAKKTKIMSGEQFFIGTNINLYVIHYVLNNLNGLYSCL